MGYFLEFPKLMYDLNKDGNKKVITNLLRRVAIRQNLKTNANIFEDHYSSTLDRPEILADKIYGDPELHWVIMMMNDVVDPFYDFTIDDQSMETYLNTKYPGQAFFLDDGLTGDTTNIETQPRASDPRVMFPKGARLHSGTSRGTVYRFNKTYQRLEVTDISGSFSVGDEILARVDGETVTTATIGRVVASNPSALHHFEDSNGNFLSPFPTTSDLREGDKVLKKYIDGEDESPTVPRITNRDYEDSLNEAKRKIKLLSPKYISLVKRELEQLIGR